MLSALSPNTGAAGTWLLDLPAPSSEKHPTQHSQIHVPKSQLQSGLSSSLQPIFYPLPTSSQIPSPANLSFQVSAPFWTLDTVNTPTSQA